MSGNPGGDCHRCALQRGHRTGTAHLNRTGIAQIADAQIGGKFFLMNKITRQHEGIDILHLQTGIGDGAARCFPHQTQYGLAGTAGIRGLADTDDTGLVC
jgi:hypothetical protein